MTDFSISPNVMRIAAFACASTLGYLFLSLLLGGDRRVQSRLDDLSGDRNELFELSRARVRGAGTPTEFFKSALTSLGRYVVPDNEMKQRELKQRLIQAGIYSPAALSVFAGIRALMTIVPLVSCVVAYAADFLTLEAVACYVVPVIGFGMIGPGIWLDRCKKKRQRILRSSIPDFLDLIVACLESGMTFESALQRVTEELQTAHPALAAEMMIVQREFSVGRSADEALANFSERCGLDEARTIATFAEQARRLGTSMTEPLRTNAEMLRHRREQRAEELAHAASVKILFPTLFFIFPVVVGVLVGPAALEIKEKLNETSAAQHLPTMPTTDRS